MFVMQRVYVFFRLKLQNWRTLVLTWYCYDFSCTVQDQYTFRTPQGKVYCYLASKALQCLKKTSNLWWSCWIIRSLATVPKMCEMASKEPVKLLWRLCVWIVNCSDEAIDQGNEKVVFEESILGECVDCRCAWECTPIVNIVRFPCFAKNFITPIFITFFNWASIHGQGRPSFYPSKRSMLWFMILSFILIRFYDCIIDIWKKLNVKKKLMKNINISFHSKSMRT